MEYKRFYSSNRQQFPEKGVHSISRESPRKPALPYCKALPYLLYCTVIVS